MTEQEVFTSLCTWHGGPIKDQAEARAVLSQRLISEPGWLYLLPESLLTKLGYKFDHQFDAVDQALALVIRGTCARRIYV